MEGNKICDEDGNQAAVCCCICRYPIPNLCEEHLLKHNTDTELLHHFHLPLCATRLIDSINTKNRYELWLFKLHKTYRNLRAQCRDLDRVEERLECLRQELFHQIDAEKTKVADRLRHLRQELIAHVEAAIEATKTHALEQWVPDTELSHLIWHFDINDPASLVTVSIDKREDGNALQVSVTSRLKSLQHLTFNEPQGKSLAALQSQFEDIVRENSALKAEVARLQEEKLRQASLAAVSDKKLTEATAALKLADEQIKVLKTKLADSARTHATEIEALKQQIVKINSDSVAKAAAKDAEVIALKRECDTRVSELKNQVLSLQDGLQQEKRLKEQRYGSNTLREVLTQEAGLPSGVNPPRQDATQVEVGRQREGQKQGMEERATELTREMEELKKSVNYKPRDYNSPWMKQYQRLHNDCSNVEWRRQQLQRDKDNLQRDMKNYAAHTSEWTQKDWARRRENYQRREEEILTQQEILLITSKDLKASQDPRHSDPLR